jgi:hypothetical protein
MAYVLLVKASSLDAIIIQLPDRNHCIDLHQSCVGSPSLGVISGHFSKSEQWTLLKATVMSALGQKRTPAHVRVMSALPPKADIGPDRRVSVEVEVMGRLVPFVVYPHQIEEFG